MITVIEIRQEWREWEIIPLTFTAFDLCAGSLANSKEERNKCRCPCRWERERGGEGRLSLPAGVPAALDLLVASTGRHLNPRWRCHSSPQPLSAGREKGKRERDLGEGVRGIWVILLLSISFPSLSPITGGKGDRSGSLQFERERRRGGDGFSPHVRERGGE